MTPNHDDDDGHVNQEDAHGRLGVGTAGVPACPPSFLTSPSPSLITLHLHIQTAHPPPPLIHHLESPIISYYF